MEDMETKLQVGFKLVGENSADEVEIKLHFQMSSTMECGTFPETLLNKHLKYQVSIGKYDMIPVLSECRIQWGKQAPQANKSAASLRCAC